MSPLEIIGAILGIIYVLLEYKASLWLWLFGFLMDVCYTIIYLQAHYYANAALYVYYMATCLWGACLWLRSRKKAQEQGEEDVVKSMPAKGWIPVVLCSAALTVVLAFVLQRMGESQYVWFDGLTAALSCVGMIVMAKKFYQQWVFWIVTNPIYVVFMAMSGMYFLAGMYAFYTIISILGFVRWKKMSVEKK
ncbi:MAG: nicotinamide riboside transporter PnuC [Bacteroidales bacterium]|nr:nicotinamide riboside transporter PnuC [Bacteroidales bacterium]